MTPLAIVMTTRHEPGRWERLLELIEPIHHRARLSARRLCSTSEDGDDLFQEALVRAYEKLPALRDPRRFAGWFYAVLLSVHRNRCRRATWRRFLRLDDLVTGGGRSPGAGLAMVLPMETPAVPAPSDHGQAARLSRALQGLPTVQREAIVLHDIDGYPLEEIARMQRVTLSAVKTRVARGRGRLRRHYERMGIRPATRAAGSRRTVPEGNG